MPPGENGAYRLDDATGDEDFLVVFCTARWPELEQALARGGGSELRQVLSAGEVRSLQARAKGSAGVVVSKLDKPTSLLAGRSVAWSEKEYRANGPCVIGYRRIVHAPPPDTPK